MRWLLLEMDTSNQNLYHRAHRGSQGRTFPFASCFTVKIHKQLWSFIHPHPVQPGALELGGQALPDGYRDVFRGGDFVQELRYLFIEETVVHGVEHFAVDDFFELLEVDYETGAGVDFAFYRDFERVVVAVAIRVIALAEDAAVFFRSERRIVVVVRCGEFSFAREIDHKSSC